MKQLLEFNSVNTVQSIKRYYGLNTEHESNKNLDVLFNEKKPKHVVLMCLDGFGYSFLPHTPFLRGNVLQKVDTVFPPTTASATITLQTGLYPCEHGWIGWSQYFEEFDDVIELFSGNGFYNQNSYNYDEVIKDIKFDAFYNYVPNSKIFFPPADKFIPNNYNSISDQFKAVKKHMDSNDTTFSYVYWAEPDTTLHKEGSKSKVVHDLLLDIDTQIKETIDLFEDTLVIITADHGHIDNEKFKFSEFEGLEECFSKKPSIEPRFTNFFIKPDFKTQFELAVKPLLPYFDLYTKEEFKNADFFNNGKMHPKLDKFLGDYVLIATDKYILELKDKFYASAHAGCTELEMEIPLITIER